MALTYSEFLIMKAYKLETCYKNLDYTHRIVCFVIVFYENFDYYVCQVCAYKDGKMIIDTAAGVMGKDDPRPVQHDTLFPVFSVTKGVTAGMIHWLADKGYFRQFDIFNTHKGSYTWYLIMEWKEIKVICTFILGY